MGPTGRPGITPYGYGGLTCETTTVLAASILTFVTVIGLINSGLSFEVGGCKRDEKKSEKGVLILSFDTQSAFLP